MGRPHRGPAPGPLPGPAVGRREEPAGNLLMITRNPPRPPDPGGMAVFFPCKSSRIPDRPLNPGGPPAPRFSA
jgi:hypothetical protein